MRELGCRASPPSLDALPLVLPRAPVLLASYALQCCLPHGRIGVCITRWSAALTRRQGKKLLPLPTVDASSADKTAREKDRVHAYETAVVTWTRQIKNVLKAEPEQVSSRVTVGSGWVTVG